MLRDDGFLTMRNLSNIVQQTAPVTIMAVGMVFVLSAGEIDLSIGSIVAVSALAAAVVLRQLRHGGRGASPGLGAGLGIGAHQRRCSSPIVRLPSFLVTLATMGLFAGVARSLTDLRSVPVTNATVHRPLRRGQPARRAVAGALDGARHRSSATSSTARPASAPMCCATGDNAARGARVRHQRRRGCASPC